MRVTVGLEALLAKTGLPRFKRRLGMRAETNFWTEWIVGNGGDNAEDFRGRLDPNMPIDDDFVAPRVASTDSETVRILDVGAGPATTIGKTFPGKRIELTAVDPLADQYTTALQARGLTPPVPTLACEGEELSRRFPPASFDIVHARNSLDHARDPLLVIEQMLEIACSGGIVLLFHGRNEAVKEKYMGLHQWNFDLEPDGRLVLWGRDRREDVAARVEALAEVSAWLDVSDEGERVAVEMRRR